MYNYDFENESISLEIVDNLATINDVELKVNILVTKENILLFRNIKAGSVLSSRGIYEMPEYELIVKLDLNKINYKIIEDNTVIDFGNKEIVLYNFDISKVIL